MKIIVGILKKFNHNLSNFATLIFDIKSFIKNMSTLNKIKYIETDVPIDILKNYRNNLRNSSNLENKKKFIRKETLSVEKTPELNKNMSLLKKRGKTPSFKVYSQPKKEQKDKKSLDNIQKFNVIKNNNQKNSNSNNDSGLFLQKFIDNPLLLDNRKFCLK